MKKDKEYKRRVGPGNPELTFTPRLEFKVNLHFTFENGELKSTIP